MSSTAQTYGWETLAPVPNGRRLIDRAEHHQLSGKVRTNGQHKGWQFVKTWNYESGWSHLGLDTPQTGQAQGWGKTERESYRMLRDALAAKGMGAASAD